ncbi:MAG: class I SAM-dependent methyltransferase [Micromonosporaceae bacterium]
MTYTIANTQQHQAWNSWEGDYWAEHAAHYDAMLGDFNAPLLDAAGITSTDRVLDVGCGCGQTTRLAGRQAVRGDAVGIDLAGQMLAYARARAAEEEVNNVTFEQGDAQVHPFPDAGFDVAISRGGVMFFADLVAGFRNIRRALRPGGRLAFVGPQPPNPDGDFSRAISAVAPHLKAPSPAAIGMMSLIDPARIQEVLTEAGFRDIAIAPVEGTENLGRDAADAADFVGGLPPLEFNLSELDQATRDRLREELADGFRPYETPEGVRVRGAVWLVTAVRA